MKLISCLVLVSFHLGIFAQSNFCGTSIHDEAKIIEDQKQYISSGNQDQATQYIPLKVHNVSNDNSIGFFAPWALFETLCTLNEDFAPSGIQFFLDNDFNYIRNTSWNDHEAFEKGEEMMEQSNFPNVVNCYLVTNPAGNCGYFTYSGDAVALGKNCLGKQSHTWAHELGHYFSLPHTFFGWEGIKYSNSKKTQDFQSQVFTSIENVERDFCKNQADRFCDTHPDYISNRWTCAPDGFSGNILRDTRDSTFRADGSLFMSYSNDDCMNRFSSDQMVAMEKNINGQRSYLKRTNVLPKFIEKTGIELHFPIDSQVVSTSKILISWEPKANAKYYIIQISRTENFTVVIKNLLLTNPYVEIDSLIQGKNYWWRVRAFSEFDFCGAESAPGIFKTKAIVNLENQFYDTELALIPNPASSFDRIQLDVNNLFTENLKVEIRNLNAQLISINTPEIIGSKQILQLNYMPDGVYIIHLSDKIHSIAKKLIIKNK
ncbi:MAG: T9SS type A sorting domain-containing protein [Saprospiraceae bacterium]|nr:T9SS type A sorting domain-containing protein [Saprospiraceae bacterium]